MFTAYPIQDKSTNLLPSLPHELEIFTDASIRRLPQAASHSPIARPAGVGYSYFHPEQGWKGEYSTLGFRRCSTATEIEGIREVFYALVCDGELHDDLVSLGISKVIITTDCGDAHNRLRTERYTTDLTPDLYHDTDQHVKHILRSAESLEDEGYEVELKCRTRRHPGCKVADKLAHIASQASQDTETAGLTWFYPSHDYKPSDFDHFFGT